MNVLLTVGTDGFAGWIDKYRPTLEKWWPWDIRFWQNVLPPDSPPHQDQPYAFKAFAMKWAFQQGYETATWIDSVIHMEGPALDYMSHLRTHGHYFQNNGFSCAQTCSDKMLSHYGLSRDDVERVPEVVGGFWGLHHSQKDFVEELVENSKLGLFSGFRDRNPEDSKDPRFLFCRHDQSLMSLMVHKRGWIPKVSGSDTTYFNYRASKESIQPVECFVLERDYVL